MQCESDSNLISCIRSAAGLAGSLPLRDEQASPKTANTRWHGHGSSWLGPAGIAHNKLLAKLASGMHKPAAQTVVPLAGVTALLHELPIGKLRQLGGKLGTSVMDTLGITTVGASA